MAALSPVDRLLAESERLRLEMLRTAEQLKTFSEQLLIEVRALRTEAGSPTGRGEQSDDGADSGGSGEAGS
jgi:hypothetical protein